MVPKINKATEFKGKFIFRGGILSLFVGATGPLTAPFFINSELNTESFIPKK